MNELVMSLFLGQLNVIFMVKKSLLEEYDLYIIVLFLNVMLVLFIGDIVSEVNDSGILGIMMMFQVCFMSDEFLFQIYLGGLCYIKVDKCINEWCIFGCK